MKHKNKLPVVSIVGKSSSGKTTLIEKLIPELKQRNLRIATIKHHAHPGFEIDVPGKDTWRHAQAGSDLVVIAAPDKIASIQKTNRNLTLDEIIDTIPGIKDIDIILTEGFLRAGKPAIEVIRKTRGTDLICPTQQLIAIATDISLEYNIPQYNIDDATSIVDFLINEFNITTKPKFMEEK